MLGRNYRFSINNDAGVNVGVVIKARPWKFVAGVLTYGAEVEVFNNGTIATSATAWTAGSAQDNSSDVYIGADLKITITPAASATGVVSVQIQRSTDAASTWPSGGLGEPVAANYFAASSTAVDLAGSIG